VAASEHALMLIGGGGIDRGTSRTVQPLDRLPGDLGDEFGDGRPAAHRELRCRARPLRAPARVAFIGPVASVANPAGAGGSTAIV
jgi:hypothetical protein